MPVRAPPLAVRETPTNAAAAPFVVVRHLVTASVPTVTDAPDGGSAPDSTQRRILVVDDDGSQRHNLTTALAPRFRTHWATSADQGLAQWRSVSPDLVVIGLELPGVGLDALLEIRRTSSLPVIVVSG